MCGKLMAHCNSSILSYHIALVAMSEGSCLESNASTFTWLIDMVFC